MGDVFDFLQNNTFSRADLTYEYGEVKNVHYGDILTKFNDCLNVDKTALPYLLSTELARKFSVSLLCDGDVIMADTAEDEAVGKCVEIVNLRENKVLAGLHTIPMRPRFFFGTGYLGHYMNSSAYHSQLLPLMQGIKVTSVSKNVVRNTNILFPKNMEEQKKIGAFFERLDGLIALHQRKCKTHTI